MTETYRPVSPLDPIDRLSEVMFGLLMALTFTGTMSVTLGAGGTVKGILLAAIGCNIAWGIVDAIVYTVTTVTERVRGRAQVAAIRAAPEAEARARLRALLPEDAGAAMNDAETDAIITWLKKHRGTRPGQTVPGTLTRDDLGAGLLIFLTVTGATWPPILPFLLIDRVQLAMRLSNAIAVGMLFAIGWFLDQQMQTGARMMRWIVPVIGTVLVAVTIALGG